MMAETIDEKYLPLTLRNVMKVLEKVEDWRGLMKDWARFGVGEGLGDCLRVPHSKLDQIERRHSSTADRMTAVIEYWLLTDPTPSWRRLICALVKMREHEVADMVRPYAEPLTDSTLTFENVTGVIASVVEWYKLGEWIGVPKPKLDRIREQYTNEDQGKSAMVREWLDSSPNVSWAILAEGLYSEEEETALEEVKGYLQKQQQDSTVTVTNLWNVLKGVGLWFGDSMGLVECFAIPESRYWEIAYCTEGDRRQCFLEYWVATHPAPSWMVVAEALYLLRRVDSRQALEVVRRKYLIGISLYELCLHYIMDDYEYFSPLVHHLPTPVQRQIIQRRKIHCDSDTEYWELVRAEKRTVNQLHGRHTL